MFVDYAETLFLPQKPQNHAGIKIQAASKISETCPFAVLRKHIL